MELSSNQFAVLNYLGRNDVESAGWGELDRLTSWSVQNTLNALARRGLIDRDFSPQVDSPDYIVRKPYSITLAGQRALAERSALKSDRATAKWRS